MYPDSAEYKFIVLMLVVEALVYLGLALWFLGRPGAGGGSAAGALGGLLAGLAAGINAAPAFQSSFLDDSGLAEFLYLDHEHIQTVLVAGRVLGVLLLALGVVLLRRTPAETPPSTYGS